MVIKIDLEKAYDRVRWAFLMNCLHELKLPENVVKTIEWCISTTRMQVLWNGEKGEQFFQLEV